MNRKEIIKIYSTETRQQIGLNTYLYSFENEKDFKDKMQELSDQGKIEIRFINNGYAFEFTKNRVIY